jgi:uncharacterized membrane protein YhaH (DUF805 family)
MFKRPFSFNGRIRRFEFGLSYIFYFFFLFVFGAVSEELNLQGILIFFLIPLFWFILAQGAKRCHDRGNSGFFLIIPLYILWMLFGDSDFGENEYGPNPKGEGNETEIDSIGKTEEEL